MLINSQLLNSEQIGPQAQAFGASLRAKVVGQEQAINEVVEVYQTFLLGIASQSRPAGSFLFLGPTGTGKTRLAEGCAT